MVCFLKLKAGSVQSKVVFSVLLPFCDVVTSLEQAPGMSQAMERDWLFPDRSKNSGIRADSFHKFMQSM